MHGHHNANERLGWKLHNGNLPILCLDAKGWPSFHQDINRYQHLHPASAGTLFSFHHAMDCFHVTERERELLLFQTCECIGSTLLPIQILLREAIIGKMAWDHLGHLLLAFVIDTPASLKLRHCLYCAQVLQAQLHSAAQHAQGVSQQLDLVRLKLAQQPQPSSQVKICPVSRVMCWSLSWSKGSCPAL